MLVWIQSLIFGSFVDEIYEFEWIKLRWMIHKLRINQNLYLDIKYQNQNENNKKKFDNATITILCIENGLWHCV